MSSSGTRESLQLGPYAARVAAITAVGLAAVVVLLVLAASRDTYEVRAVFDDVRGLIPGGDVTAGSITVGTVTEVALNEQGDPEVVMEIDDDLTLHEGAFANVRLASNIGAVNRVVDLTEGDPSLGELPSGVTLSGRQTDNPVNFDLAASTLDPKVRGEIKDTLLGLEAALAERGSDIDRTLEHSSRALNETAKLLTEANRDGEALRTIVADGQKIVSALASSPGDLGAAAERTATLLRTTAARQTELAASVQRLGPALAGGRQLLERTEAAVPNLRTLVAGSGPLVEKLGPFADLVPPATEAAGPFLEQTRKLVEETPAVLRQQRPLLRRAKPVVKRLIPLTEQLNPIADQLRVFTPETVGFFQNAADAAAPYDANGHMIRIATGAGNSLPPSTAAGGEIGPSDCSPGLLIAPYHRTPGVNECDPWDEWRQSFIAGEDGG